MYLHAAVVTAVIVRSNLLAYDSKLILCSCSRVTPAVVCLYKKQYHSMITGFPRDVRSRIPRRLKMGPTRCPETSIRNYHHALCNISEGHISQDHSTIFVLRILAQLAEANEMLLMFARDFFVSRVVSW